MSIVVIIFLWQGWTIFYRTCDELWLLCCGPSAHRKVLANQPEEFWAMTIGDFCQVTSLLDTKELPSSNEEDVLLAALRWITHGVVSRRRHSFHLLSSVRFRSLTLRDLDRAVSLLPQTQDKSFAVVIATLRKDLETGQLFKWVGNV